MLRLLNWNIRHGGGKNLPRVVDTILAYDAQIVVLTEFQVGPRGCALITALAAAGYATSHPPAAGGSNTVFVASRSEIKAAGPLAADFDDPGHLWRVSTACLDLVAVYMPQGKHKDRYWEKLISCAATDRRIDLIVGDLNTGKNEIDKSPAGVRFTSARFMPMLEQAGYVDVWRSRHPDTVEFTWYYQGGNGFRLDHVFIRTGLNEAVHSCVYDHASRLAGISDHSAMLVDMDVTEQPLPAPVEPAICHVIPGQTPQANDKIGGCIYALFDEGYPGLVKVGKDTNWPQRFQEAQSHSPRGLKEVGRWDFPASTRSQLYELERQALSAFTPYVAAQGREWVVASPEQVRRVLTSMFGEPRPKTPLGNLKIYDPWRDWINPTNSKVPRYFWLARETNTGRLKILHSNKARLPGKQVATYSGHGLEWFEAWTFPATIWSASAKLHALDRALVNLWNDLVTNHGYGKDDLRVGWLKVSADLDAIRTKLEALGLVRVFPIARGSVSSESERGLESGVGK